MNASLDLHHVDTHAHTAQHRERHFMHPLGDGGEALRGVQRGNRRRAEQGQPLQWQPLR